MLRISNFHRCILFFSLLTVLINYAEQAQYSAEDCKTLGYNVANLLCTTCNKLENYELNDLQENCKNCCSKDEEDSLASKRYPKAILEVCTCKFGAYPQIQAFIKSDRPSKYKNLKINYVRGLDPIIRLYDSDNRVQDVLDIHKWNTDSIDEFLATHLSMD